MIINMDKVSSSVFDNKNYVLDLSPTASNIRSEIIKNAPEYTDPEAGRKVQEQMLKYGVATVKVPGILLKMIPVLEIAKNILLKRKNANI